MHKGVYPTDLLKFAPENMLSKSLEEVEREVRMPWGLPFGSDDFVQAANTAKEIVEEKSYAFIPKIRKRSKKYEVQSSYL